MNNQELQELIDAMRKAVYLFRDRGYRNPLDNAQDQLLGRTQYVNDETLRFFNARVLKAYPICSGLFYRIVESVENPNHDGRFFRFVIFDVWGQVVARPEFEDSFKNTNDALKAAEKWLEGFDPWGYYKQAIDSKKRWLNFEIEKLEDVRQVIEEARETA